MKNKKLEVRNKKSNGFSYFIFHISHFFKTKKYPAFTLIELLVVMMMIGILAVISVPDFRQYQMREQLRSSVTETSALLAEAFAQARAQSQHQHLEILSDSQLSFCSIPQETGVTPICKMLDLPGNITVEPVSEAWFYRAPHGDISSLGGDLELIFTHSSGNTKSLKIHAQSGLVEEL